MPPWSSLSFPDKKNGAIVTAGTTRTPVAFRLSVPFADLKHESSAKFEFQEFIHSSVLSKR